MSPCILYVESGKVGISKIWNKPENELWVMR